MARSCHRPPEGHRAGYAMLLLNEFMMRIGSVQFDQDWGCDARPIPGPAAENAGLPDDSFPGRSHLPQTAPLLAYWLCIRRSRGHLY